MGILIILSQILNLLFPIMWGISLLIYTKKGKLEALLALLSAFLLIIGIISCISVGLDLFGLE